MINNNKGFTLVEVLTVVLIIAILVAIAIPVYSNITEKAAQNVLSYNSHSASIYPLLRIEDYDDDHLYGNDDEFLSLYLYNEIVKLETTYKNPYTDSRSILHNSSIPAVAPALFITNMELTDEQKNSFAGTIVIYLDNHQLPIQIYALNKKGDMIEQSFHEVYR